MIDEYEESKDERATRERDMEALRIENAELRAEVMHVSALASESAIGSSHPLPAIRQTGNNTGNIASANTTTPFPFSLSASHRTHPSTIHTHTHPTPEPGLEA